MAALEFSSRAVCRLLASASSAKGTRAREGETQALIEIILRAVVRGRDLVSNGAKSGPQRRLVFRECRRGAGCAHIGAWHFGLCQAKHHVRQAGCGRRVADGKIRTDEWRRYVHGG